MKRAKWIIFGVLWVVCLGSSSIWAMNAVEIMQKVDDFQYADSMMMEAEMLIVNGNREMTKEMIMYGEGSKALCEFINPRDRGTKFLKIGEELWMFFPGAEEVVKISGHMLEQGLMGSDFSYQDAMEAEKLVELYNFTLIGEEEVDGRLCYVIEGVMQEGKKVSYYRRVSWVDQERFVLLKEELYAQSGRLLKVSESKQVEKIGERWYPMESVMINMLKQKTRTELKIKSLEFDVEIDQEIFSTQNLR